MGKLEAFDRMQTNWEGLWWHGEYNGFSSACISLSELRKFKGKVRLYVRKNKFYNNGENGRPNYHWCLKDADSDVFHVLDIEQNNDDEYPKDSDGNRLYTGEEVRAVINGVVRDVEYGIHDPYDLLISDYV